MDVYGYLVSWMIAGFLVGWWGVWPLVGQSIEGIGSMVVIPGAVWVMLVGTSVMAAGWEATALVSFTAGIAVLSLESLRRFSFGLWWIGSALLFAMVVRGLLFGGLMPVSAWEFFLTGTRSGRVVEVADFSVLTFLFFLTSAFGWRQGRRVARLSLLSDRPLGAILLWSAGAVCMVPVISVMGLLATAVGMVLLPPAIVLYRPRGMALASWSGLVGSAIGLSAGICGLLGLSGGAVVVIVISLLSHLPCRLPQSEHERWGA